MFQLLSITIQKHPIFGYAEISFCSNEPVRFHQNGNQTSVIIGKNGIGKSYLLRAIVEIFKTVDALANGVEVDNKLDLGYRFCVNYYLNGHTYSISDINLELQALDGRRLHSYIVHVDQQEAQWQDIRLPNKLIASSMTISDKFPTPSVGRYLYRGVRSEKTPSTTGTRTIVRKAVDGIIDSLVHKHTTRNEISIILSELGFQSRLEIRYKFRYKNVFLRNDMTPELLHDIYTNWREYFQNRSGEVWGAKYYRTLSNNPAKLNVVCEFIRRYANVEDINRRNLLIYDVFDENNFLVYDSEAIKILSNLDILTFPELKVYKLGNDNGYDFVESSSGETQQLCQFISIMSAIELNSLVLIDEPENSSHPNWQMSYIGWLQKIFRGYRDCHFIIATHSHFLLTDLNPEWSSIIALDKEGHCLRNIAGDVNTFCWSTDDILYRVFHVRNTRNYVFENDIMQLYSLISEGKKDTQEARLLASRLNEYKLPGNDPLLQLLDMMKDA